MKIETRDIRPQGVDLVEIARALYGRSTDKQLRTVRVSVTLHARSARLPADGSRVGDLPGRCAGQDTAAREANGGEAEP